MLTAKEVVSSLKTIEDPHSGVTKTMKLLYYLQGIHLVAFGEPLFEDIILHHKLGLFVPAVHESYVSIMKSEEASASKAGFIRDVVQMFSTCSAAFLVDKTHSEDPWKSTKLGDEISIEILYEFFSSNNEFQQIILKHSPPPPPVGDFSALNKFLDIDDEDEEERLKMVTQIKESIKPSVKV